MEEELISLTAKRIKALRKQQGFTLKELSERLQLSKGLLSKVENSRTIPSFPVLLGIMQALDTHPKEFFEGIPSWSAKEYLHIRKQDYKPMQKEKRKGFDYKFVFSQSVKACNLEVAILRVKPNAQSKPTTSDGYEYKYILSGSCDYHINEEIISLEEGDSLYFDASRPHMPINKGKRSVIMLVIYLITRK